jgi:hypothetical protein
VIARVALLAVLASGCASSYKVTAGLARGLDTFAVALPAADAQVKGNARSPLYLKVRNDAALAIEGAAPLLPAGCASDLSSLAVVALAHVGEAYAKFAAMVTPATSHTATLDPAITAAIINASAAAAPALFQGIAAIVSGAQAAAAQAQADCVTAVVQAQADAAALDKKLVADDVANAP